MCQFATRQVAWTECACTESRCVPEPCGKNCDPEFWAEIEYPEWKLHFIGRKCDKCLAQEPRLSWKVQV
ncbi:hypothetical protein N7495_009037 [Penicillium taxi]|uniref:uncharacterized protein n=1 Tax=Penicillium taxi TaxID=168475 RepID=UPI0025450A57|nr:uncharacterized protein N7495_009037 [Penicillium taxi]KAJ5888996.1 hypothetical protein N7495_009037 [Penicillium taxi]